MSDCFDHACDAFDSYDYSGADDLFYGFEPSRSKKTSDVKDYCPLASDAFEKYIEKHDIKNASEFDDSKWYGYKWFKVLKFHKDYEKTVLVTIYDNYNEQLTTKFIPKKVIGKIEYSYIHGDFVEFRYMIHYDVYQKLDFVNIKYMYSGKEYDYLFEADGLVHLKSNDIEVTVPSNLTEYVRYEKYTSD
jgi:hypothetical protein